MILNGKKAVVTGATRGIGKAIADLFAAQGATVARVGRSATGETGFACDVADFDAVKTTCDAIVRTLGGVDILVNNAGITRDGLLLAMKEEDFDAVVATNLKGTFNFTRHLTRYLMKSGAGRIVNVASVVGVSGNIGQANYAASKAGVIGFTKTVARELAGRKVTCNAIAPGFIETDMTDAMPAEATERILAQIPLKRMGTPDEIAHLALFLASDFASYITGEVIKADGGLAI